VKPESSTDAGMRALWLYYDSLVAEEERERAGVQ
jgi:hypothetical protein